MPVEIAPLILAGAIGSGRVIADRRSDPDSWVPRVRQASFAAGVLSAAVVTSSPLAGLTERSLLAHMTQHVVLMFVAAPLLALGAPLRGFAPLIEVGRRERIMRGWSRFRPEDSPRRALVWMTATALVQIVVMLGWHGPPFFDAADRNEIIHAIEHVSFLATSGAFWWAVLSPDCARHRGLGVLTVFVATMPGAILGLAMVIAHTPWYAAYRSLSDQQYAGAVMWAGGGGIAVGIGIVLFGWWLASVSPEPRGPDGPVAAPVVDRL